MEHPAGNKRTATADNIHYAAFGKQCLQHVAIDAAVNGHEISTIFGLLFDNSKQIFFCHVDNGTVFLDGFYCSLINRYGTNHDGGSLNNCLARSFNVVTGTEIHHCIGTGFNGGCQFQQFRLWIRVRTGSTDVSVDFGCQTFADTTGTKAFMIGVGTDGDSSFCNTGTDCFCRQIFFGCYDTHCFCNNALSGGLHLCKHILRSFVINKIAVSDIMETAGEIRKVATSLRRHYPEIRFQGSTSSLSALRLP